jgi:hypothetical protein
MYNQREQLRISFDGLALQLTNDLLKRLKDKGLTPSLSDLVNMLIDTAYFYIETESKDIETLFVNYKLRGEK